MKRGPKKGYKQSPDHIAARITEGKDHPRWMGDDISEKGGRARALRWYPELGPCIKCGSPRSERHHKDRDTANNEAGNIQPLCRKCHMKGDGRLDKLIEGTPSAINKAISAAAKIRKNREVCKRGHPLSGFNLYINPKGARCCKECQRIAVRKYLEKKDVK